MSGASSQLHSEIYRQTLSNLLNEISFDKKLVLDHQLLQRNYRFLLLVLLSQEANKETAAAELGRIAEEWERVVQEGDFEFLLSFFDILEGRTGELLGEPACDRARKSVAEHVEGCLLRGETHIGLDVFVEKLGRSLYGWESYEATLLKDRIVTPSLLRACVRFFPDEAEELFPGLKKKRSDGDLLGKVADALKPIDTPWSLAALKNVYDAGDAGVKVKALQAMQGLAEFDEAFLFPVLEQRNESVQAEALILLMRNERTKHVAFTKLFRIQSPYGLRNKKILRHLRVVEAHGLRDARPYIEPLAERKDVWNRKVRQEAGRLLEKWREG